MVGGKSPTPCSFPLNCMPKHLPGPDQEYKTLMPGLVEGPGALKLPPRPTDKIRKSDLDEYVRDLEVTVMKLFSRRWVANPRIDPANPGNVILDGTYMIPDVLHDKDIVLSVVRCAARFFQHYGAGIEIVGYRGRGW